MNIKKSSFGLCVVGTATIFASPALAQERGQITQEADQTSKSSDSQSGDNESSGLQDIIVTAQRRKERLQDVPIAVTALSMAAAENKGVSGSMDLAAAIPNLSLMQSGGSFFNPFIRGVGQISGGPNAEPSVATYVDGVYIASPSAAGVMSFNSIERVEVLKGPQGTLFGRNATGGVIQIVTTRSKP